MVLIDLLPKQFQYIESDGAIAGAFRKCGESRGGVRADGLGEVTADLGAVFVNGAQQAIVKGAGVR